MRLRRMARKGRKVRCWLKDAKRGALKREGGMMTKHRREKQDRLMQIITNIKKCANLFTASGGRSVAIIRGPEKDAATKGEIKAS
jgi:hypothetical protein